MKKRFFCTELRNIKRKCQCLVCLFVLQGIEQLLFQSIERNEMLKLLICVLQKNLKQGLLLCMYFARNETVNYIIICVLRRMKQELLMCTSMHFAWNETGCGVFPYFAKNETGNVTYYSFFYKDRKRKGNVQF